MKQGRRDFLKAASLMAAATWSTRAASAAREAPPNILFILADDLGYADLGCFGSRHIRTPVLDRLAARGIRMTDAYANSPVCSPTRLALATGRYHTRFKSGLIEPFRAGAWGDQAIPAGQPTLPSLLRAQGYYTSLVGKWHLGDTPQGGPLAHGYEHFFGFLGGGIDYFTHEYQDKPALRSGNDPAEREGYLTTVLADEAIGVVRRSAARRQPFALSLHLNAPHWPWEGPEDRGLGTQGAHYDGGSLAVYARMTESMDHQIGRVLAELERRDLTRNTWVVFTSDNGGERFSETWPFRGAKGFLLEGGIRVPTVIHHPRLLPRGRVSAQTCLTMDWMPTLLEAARIPADSWPELDGVSLLTALRSGQVTDRTLFWRFQGHRQRAARRGRWKYYQVRDSEFLYDLEIDSMERANRAKAEPARLAEMRDAWLRWNEGMVSDDQIPGFCDRLADTAVPMDVADASICREPPPPRPTAPKP